MLIETYWKGYYSENGMILPKRFYEKIDSSGLLFMGGHHFQWCFNVKSDAFFDGCIWITFKTKQSKFETIVTIYYILIQGKLF